MSYLSRINRLRAALTVVASASQDEFHLAQNKAASALAADDHEDATRLGPAILDYALLFADDFRANPGDDAPRAIVGDKNIAAFAKQVAELTLERVNARHAAAAKASASRIYVQAYDANGQQTYKCCRSSADVHEDTRIMDAAIELVHARRRGVAISDKRLAELIEGRAEMPEDFPEGEPVDAEIGSPEHLAAIDYAVLLAMLGATDVQEAVNNAKKLLHVQAMVNTPETADFAAGVLLEAAHQRMRWGAKHDAGKAPEDWFWLLGYLSGKVLRALAAGDQDKALHHCISSAAALCNWHAAIAGDDTSMRPGIDPVAKGIEREGVPA